MDQFWDKIILDNSVQQYAIVLGVMLFAYLFKQFLGRYVSSLFFRVMHNVGRRLERAPFMDLIIGPVEQFLFVLISYFAISSLQFPEILEVRILGLMSSRIVDSLAGFILIYFFFRMVLRLVDYMALIMEKKADLLPEQDDNQLVIFLKDFSKIIIVIIAILVTLKSVFGQDITKLLAGLSIVGAAIALAARESLENLIASFIIFFDKPFTTGDLVKVNSISGNVEKIGLRSTRIRTAEKTYVTVPNKQMVDSIVDNLQLRTHRRGELKIQLDARTKAADVEALVKELPASCDLPAITDVNVQITDITAVGFVVTMEFLSTTLEYKAFHALKDQVQIRVIELLQKKGIQLAGEASPIKILRD